MGSSYKPLNQYILGLMIIKWTMNTNKAFHNFQVRLILLPLKFKASTQYIRYKTDEQEHGSRSKRTKVLESHISWANKMARKPSLVSWDTRSQKNIFWDLMSHEQWIWWAKWRESCGQNQHCCNFMVTLSNYCYQKNDVC